MNRLLKNSTSTTAIVYLLLLVFLGLRLGGAVSHYCFDGIEPPVTIHFDNFNGHVDHDAGAGHTDTEKQVLADNLLNNVFDFESLLVIAALFLFSLLSPSGGQAIPLLAVPASNSAKYQLPPLRAPPLYS